MHVTSERHESLWWLAAAPSLWMAHFFACYLTAAIWCAKAVDRGGSLEPVRWAIAGYTLLALAGIFAIGWHGLRRHETGTATTPHDFDTAEDRHRFLGFATLLLSGLAAVATLFQAAVALFFRSCW